jgi:hypothetical protein
MRVLGPKFIRKANSWCVTVFTHNKSGESQISSWFSTEAEAKAFKEKNEAQAKEEA